MLTKEQLGQLKSKLNEMKAQSSPSSLYQSSDLSFGSIAGEVHDTGDESVASETIDVNATIANLRKQESDEIDAALQRIAGNNYGTCIDCRIEIKFDRLLAYPAAKRCLDCKSQFERTN